MAIQVEPTLKWMVEGAQIDPIKIRDWIRTKLETKEIKALLAFCQENAGRDLPKKNYGYVHQDLINALGEKLGFTVSYGDYTRGPDGIWTYKNISITIESKTSPTWLEVKQANEYVDEQKATSGLVVCPNFTEDQEKAVRGGYPKIRLLTTEGLCKLAELKDGNKVSTDNVIGILVPQETVKLDYFIDIIYKIMEAPPEAEGAFQQTPKVKTLQATELAKPGMAVIERLGERANKGEITPLDAYTRPILEALVEMGGRGRVKEVLDRVYEKMKDKLTKKDLERIPSGGSVRWRKNAQWQRFRLVEQGYLKKGSPSGIWEITEEGRKLLSQTKP